MKKIPIWRAWMIFSLGIGLSLAYAGTKEAPSYRPYLKHAQKLAHTFILVDTHIDVPYRLKEKWEDISKSTEHGEFDLPRAKKGGLNVAFFSIYIPARFQDDKKQAKKVAQELINMVEKIVDEHPEDFALAFSVKDVRQQFAEGKFSIALGMENGTPIHSRKDLEYFYKRGIRYITLAHSKWNHISDSSYDDDRKWKGLSPFGEKMVHWMNELGIMIDVSHITDEAVLDVLKISKAPVIASHSSCRKFTPGWERNVSDDIIRAIARKGGVIQINFGASFISDTYRQEMKKIREETKKYMEKNKLSYDDPKVKAYWKSLKETYQPTPPTVADVADHIDHIVKLVGIDHVGLGSDFDGVSGNLPSDLKDVSMYPNLIAELLRRGYTEEHIRKIMGENLLRVWEQVEHRASR